MLPVHATAPGKRLAAWKTDEELAAILNAVGMDPYTPRTITSLSRFMDELQQIRQSRFALDDEEIVRGLRNGGQDGRGRDRAAEDRADRRV